MINQLHSLNNMSSMSLKVQCVYSSEVGAGQNPASIILVSMSKHTVVSERVNEK